MTYQPKSEDKMADFEAFPLCISKSKSNVYLFLQGLSCRVLSVPGRNFRFLTAIHFQTDFVTHILWCMTSRGIRVLRAAFFLFWLPRWRLMSRLLEVTFS